MKTFQIINLPGHAMIYPTFDDFSLKDITELYGILLVLITELY